MALKVSDALLFILSQQPTDGMPSYEIDRLLSELHKFGCVEKGTKSIDGFDLPVWLLTEKGRRIVDRVSEIQR